MPGRVYLAVDLGASSGRVLAGMFDGRVLEVSEVHRFANGAVDVNGQLYWRTFELWHNVLVGLRRAGREFGDRVVSIGVDAWGVDFALLDHRGELLAAPVAYRDARTHGELERAFAVVPREEIFAQTGVQFMEINTLYQLLTVKRTGSPPLDHAARLLLIPDLLHWMLTGEAANESTIASTTQLFNPRTGDWSGELIDRFDLPRQIFGPLREPGTTLGPLRAAVADDTGLKNATVVLPASHDTASAVLAVPAAAGEPFTRPLPGGERGGTWAYVSSGTWSLMGVETLAPIVNDDSLRWNFTNERGVAGTTRLLKNIAGLWLVQECQRVWRLQGHDYDWQELVALAEVAPPLAGVFDPDDPRLTAPSDMPAALIELIRETGRTPPPSHGGLVRAALESLALTYRTVLFRLERLIGAPIERIHVVGGGARNRLLCQMTADACRRPVFAGPVEATAIGNLLMQLIAVGDVADVSQAREIVRRSFELVTYLPREDDPLGASYATPNRNAL